MFSDLDVVVVGYLSSLLVGISLAVFFLFYNNAIKISSDPIYEFRETFSFSLPVTLNAGIQYLVSWTDILLLGVFVSATPLGQYQAAYQTSLLLLVVIQAANSIFPSVAADLDDAGRRTQLNRVYTAVTKWITYLTILGLLFVVIYSDDVLSIFGTVTESAKLALIILAIGQAIDAIIGPTGYMLIMSGYERIQLANSIVIALLNLVLNVILIQSYGIIGAAIATGLSLALLNILRLVQVRYLLNMQPYSWQYWKGLIAVGGTVPIMVLGQNFLLSGLSRLLFIGCISFAAFSVLIWQFGFDKEDRILIESLE